MKNPAIAAILVAATLPMLSACDIIKFQPTATEPTAAEAIWQFRHKGRDKRTTQRDACMASKWQDLGEVQRRVGCSYVAACQIVYVENSWDDDMKRFCAVIQEVPSSTWSRFTDIDQTLTTINL